MRDEGGPFGLGLQIADQVRGQHGRDSVKTSLLKHGKSCDTLPGNSGSPVFDPDTRAVIAIHHAGSAQDSINFAIPMARIAAASAIIRDLIPAPDPPATNVTLKSPQTTASDDQFNISPMQATFYGRRDQAVVRSGPSSVYKHISVLKEGEEIEVIGKLVDPHATDDQKKTIWYKVKTQDSQFGYSDSTSIFSEASWNTKKWHESRRKMIKTVFEKAEASNAGKFSKYYGIYADKTGLGSSNCDLIEDSIMHRKFLIWFVDKNIYLLELTQFLEDMYMQAFYSVSEDIDDYIEKLLKNRLRYKKKFRSTSGTIRFYKLKNSEIAEGFYGNPKVIGFHKGELLFDPKFKGSNVRYSNPEKCAYTNGSMEIVLAEIDRRIAAIPSEYAKKE